MLFYASVSNIKKAALLILLIQASTIQAQTPDVDNSTLAADKAKPAAQSFPRWPERPQVNREIVPPPPPGPYMSTALNDFTVKAPALGRTMMNSPAAHHRASSVPMDTFSPDRPWPELRPTDRWKPENGYRYVAPPAKPAHHAAPAYQPPMNAGPGYKHGYKSRHKRYTPKQMQPMPVTRDGSRRQYSYPPGYAPRANPAYRGQYPSPAKQRYPN